MKKFTLRLFRSSVLLILVIFSVYLIVMKHEQSPVKAVALTVKTPSDSTRETQSRALAIAQEKAFGSLPQAVLFGSRKSLEAALKIQDPETRKAKIRDLFIEWSAMNPEAATRWVVEDADLRLDSVTRTTLIRNGIVLWAREEPRKAADYSATIPVEDPHLSSIDMALTAWAMKDITSAKAYVDQMSNKELQQPALRGLLSTLAHTDPQAAAQLATKYGTSSDQATNNGVVADEWATHDFNAAWNWANGLGEVRGDMAVMAIASSFAMRDPQSSAQWVLSLPDSANKNLAISATSFILAGQDPEAAATWIAALPDGVAKTDVSEDYIRNNGSNHPALSADVAMSLSDATQRQEKVTTILNSWLERQPAQANKWLAAHPDVILSQ